MSATRPLALITGASTGLGRVFARCAAEDGYNLMLLARDRKHLEEVAGPLREQYGVAVECRALDLSDRAALAAFCDDIRAGMPDVHLLVNNAGVGLTGDLADAEPEATSALIDIDVTAPTLLLQAVIPRMRERGAGHVLNVASLAGFGPGPGAAAYCAAKAYIKSLSEAVAHEARRSGIIVTTLCPGPVATNFAKRSGLQATRLFSGMIGVETPERVARLGWAGMKRGKRIVVPGARPKLLALTSPIAPGFLQLNIASFIFSPVRPR